MNEKNDNTFDVGKLVVGLNIVAIGLYVLLGNIGTISFGYLPFIARLWPVLLVVVGLNIIFKSQGLSYIGSLVFTAFLVLVIVASVPGQTGAGARRILAVPDEPVEISIESFADIFNIEWHGKVKESVDNTLSLETIPETVYLDFGGKWCDNANIKIVPIEKDQVAQIDYTLEIKSDNFDKTNTEVMRAWEGDELILNSPQLEQYYDLELTIYLPANTNIISMSQVNDVEITEEWFGEISIIHITSGNFKAETLNGATLVRTVSGNISINQINNSIDAQTTSGNVEIGGISSSYKDFLINLQSSNPITYEADPKAYSDAMIANNNISTTSGNISIRNIKDIAVDNDLSNGSKLTKTVSNLSVHTTSGDIFMQFLSMNSGTNSVKTTSGDVDIIFSYDVNTICNVKSVSGDISTHGGVLEKTDNVYIIGEKAQQVIDIQTVSGDISLRTE